MHGMQEGARREVMFTTAETDDGRPIRSAPLHTAKHGMLETKKRGQFPARATK